MPQTPEIIESALAELEDTYIFPDKAAEAAEAIRVRLVAGEFDTLDGPALCTAVTEVFHAVTKDKHLRLMWSDEPQQVEAEDDGAEALARAEAQSRANNHGVHRVERLDGNIGYVDLRASADPRFGARATAAAMELVANTEALIIDARKHRGGSPAGVALWCSYFFADDSVHLNDIYHRKSDRTRQFWTLAHVEGPRYLDRPIYVLTSETTFSAGEELAYNLKVNKRATLIGETTRGGAHPCDWVPLTPRIALAVPSARSINPVTGTNWEGTGVEPDVRVPAAEALDTALADVRSKIATA
jgi:C-terminal processing protease CtpA/Prc